MEITEEIWKPCKRDPDYDVSNTGKIRNKHGKYGFTQFDGWYKPFFN